MKKKLTRSKLAYSIPSLGRATDLGRTTIYKEIRDGKLIAKKCRRKTIVLRVHAEAWLDALPVLGGGDSIIEGEQETEADRRSDVISG